MLDSPDLDDEIFQWNRACVHALGHKLAKTYSKQGVQSPDHILQDKNKLKNINKHTTLTTLYAYYVHIYTIFLKTFWFLPSDNEEKHFPWPECQK